MMNHMEAHLHSGQASFSEVSLPYHSLKQECGCHLVISCICQIILSKSTSECKWSTNLLLWWSVGVAEQQQQQQQNTPWFIEHLTWKTLGVLYFSPP